MPRASRTRAFLSVHRTLSIQIVVSILLLGTASACLLVRPESVNRPPLSDPSREARVDERVGWYEVEGECVLVTFSATADLALVGLSETLFLHRWLHVEGDHFHWEVPGRPAPRSVTFGHDSRAFTWRDGSGHTATAERCEGPYGVEEIVFENAGDRLSGTVFVPTGEISGGAVMIHGSGSSHRDNVWYLQIAHALARGGVAVLLPDKRGSGASHGEWRTASFETFADDVVAGIQALAKRVPLDHEQVGLVGVSQGGHIAPLVASRQDVAWVVNLSGGAVTMNEALHHESIQNLAQMGFPRPLARALAPVAAAVPKRRRPVWWKLNGDFDPIPHWRRLEVPALVIYGGEDERDNVPVSRSVELLREADRESPGTVRIEVFENLGHGFLAADGRHIEPEVLDLLTRWVRQDAVVEISLP